jgi:hypothetical protein
MQLISSNVYVLGSRGPSCITAGSLQIHWQSYLKTNKSTHSKTFISLISHHNIKSFIWKNVDCRIIMIGRGFRAPKIRMTLVDITNNKRLRFVSSNGFSFPLAHICYSCENVWKQNYVAFSQSRIYMSPGSKLRDHVLRNYTRMHIKQEAPGSLAFIV